MANSASTSTIASVFNPGKFIGLSAADKEDAHWQGNVDENEVIQVSWIANARERVVKDASDLNVTTQELKTATEQAAYNLALHLEASKIKILCVLTLSMHIVSEIKEQSDK